MCRRCLFVPISSPDNACAVVLSCAQTHTPRTRNALVTEHDVLVRRKPRHLTNHKSKHHQVEGRGQESRRPTTTTCRVTRHRSMLGFSCRRGKVGAAHTLHAPCPMRLCRLWGHTCGAWRPKGRGKEEDMTLLPAAARCPAFRTPSLPKTHQMTTELGGLPTMHATPCATLVGKGHREAEAQREKQQQGPFEREKRRQGGRMPEEGGRAGA